MFNLINNLNIKLIISFLFYFLIYKMLLSLVIENTLLIEFVTLAFVLLTIFLT